MSLQFQDLTFRYGEKKILDDVSATLDKGKVVFLLGENGSGKTTLLKLLARLLVPQSGTIVLDGKPASHFSRRAYAQKIGVMSQTLRPALDLSVEEFCLIGRNAKLARFAGASGADLSAVHQALELVGLADRSKCAASALSGGEFQRLVLAAVLALESDYLLLDEPVSAQDPPRAKTLLAMIRRQANDRGVLMIAHTLEFAENFADEIWLLADGKIFAAGTPREVLTPENLSRVYHCRVTEARAHKSFCFDF